MHHEVGIRSHALNEEAGYPGAFVPANHSMVENVK
jgi:hypothetical protein